jgi:hypothetical protein
MADQPIQGLANGARENLFRWEATLFMLTLCMPASVIYNLSRQMEFRREGVWKKVVRHSPQKWGSDDS